VSNGQRRHANTEMDLLQIALGLETNGSASSRSRIAIGMLGGRQMAEFLLHQFENLLVGDVAGGGYEEVASSEPILETGAKTFAVKLADGLRSTKDRTAEGMLRPKAASEDIVEEILGIVEIHLDLFENDLALFLDVVGIELGPENQIRQDIEGDGQVLVKDLGVEADLFFRGESVEVAADGVHFAGDVLSAAMSGAFENHVFQEVGKSVFGGNLAAGAIADPDADGDGTNVLHGLGNDNKTVG